MEKYELQKLRDLPIEGVAERLGLRVTRHKCLCPFHDDHHASLSFSVRRNSYRCFVCGASGGVIDLVMKYLNKDFLDATKWLADENNIIVSSFKIQDSGDLKPETWNLKPFDASRYARYFERPWLSPEARRFLFDERRIDPRVVRWCRLTSWRDKQGVPWLQTPYYDREGKLIGVQNRNLTPSQPSTPSKPPRGEAINHSPSGEMERGLLPRFRFPQGARCSIYNLPVLNMLKPGEQLFITEGCSDCWAMLSAGHKAIAIPSATLLKKKDVEILQDLNAQSSLKATPSDERLEESGGKIASPLGGRLEGWGGVVASPSGGRLEGAISFHMYPDNDVPGERLFLQLKEVLPNLVRHQLPQGCKDFSEYYLMQRSQVPPAL